MFSIRSCISSNSLLLARSEERRKHGIWPNAYEQSDLGCCRRYFERMIVLLSHVPGCSRHRDIPRRYDNTGSIAGLTKIKQNIELDLAITARLPAIWSLLAKWLSRHLPAVRNACGKLRVQMKENRPADEHPLGTFCAAALGRLVDTTRTQPSHKILNEL